MSTRATKIAALMGIVGAIAVVASSACGGDACTTLADEFAACGGGSSTTSSGTSGGSRPQTCTDKERQQAQCVLDARTNGAPLDLCKIKSKMATAADQSAYDACYANPLCADGTPTPCK